MHINVKGIAKCISNKMLMSSTAWLGNKLCGPRLAKNLGIEINLVPYLRRKSDAYGICIPADVERYHREFDIELDAHLSKKSLLEALCHEMVHVKQYSRGELKERIVRSSVRHYWQGKLVNHDEIDYWERPWEIEAHGRERGLYLYLSEYLDDLAN